jgi:CRISPR-associated endonuclease Cas1
MSDDAIPKNPKDIPRSSYPYQRITNPPNAAPTAAPVLPNADVRDIIVPRNNARAWLNKLPIQGNCVEEVRNQLQRTEAQATRIYLKNFFKQFPDELKPRKRHKYNARDPLNNLLNLGYEVLKREIILSLIPMHLDPFLGFLHSYFRYKPSLIYDVIEPFRAVVEDFLLIYHETLNMNSFEKVGNRMYLRKDEEIEFLKAVLKQLEKKVHYLRYDSMIKGKIRTVIKEDTIKLAQYIRDQHQKFIPHSFLENS